MSKYHIFMNTLTELSHMPEVTSHRELLRAPGKLSGNGKTGTDPQLVQAVIVTFISFLGL